MQLPSAAILMLTLATSVSWAQDWPTRPVRVIAPFGVGGTADSFVATESARWKPMIEAAGLGRQVRIARRKVTA